MPRQTASIDTHIPICPERSADGEEEEDADGGEEGNGCYESVHGSSHLLGIHDTEKEEADGDLHERESDEGLYPIGPAENLEEASLRRSQEVFVPSQSCKDFRRDQPSAEHRGQLIKVIGSVLVRKENGLLIAIRGVPYHGSDCNVIISSHIVRKP